MANIRFVWNRGWQERLDTADAVAHFANEVEEDAKRLVPVDTGELRDSITVSVEGRGPDAIARISAGAEHALPVELGTRNTRAQPYLRPALRRKRS